MRMPAVLVLALGVASMVLLLAPVLFLQTALPAAPELGHLFRAPHRAIACSSTPATKGRAGEAT